MASDGYVDWSQSRPIRFLSKSGGNLHPITETEARLSHKPVFYHDKKSMIVSCGNANQERGKQCLRSPQIPLDLVVRV